MNIAEYERAIKRLMNWMQKVPIWQEHWSDVQQRHLGDIPGALEITQKQFEVLLGSLGEELLSAIDPVVAEDFFASRFAPGGTNVIDAYIAAAGWKENAVSRSFLEALRDSAMRFYEIVGAEGDKHWLLRQAGTDGEPLTVLDPQADADYDEGSYVGARLLSVDGETMLADGVYFYQPDETKGVLEALRLGGEKVKANLPTLATEQGIPLDDAAKAAVDRQMTASMLTAAWIVPMLVDSMSEPAVKAAMAADAEDSSEL